MIQEPARAEEPTAATKLRRGEPLASEDAAALAAYVHSEGGRVPRLGGWGEDAWQDLMVQLLLKLRGADAAAWWPKFSDPRYVRAAHKYRVRSIERAERSTTAPRAHGLEHADGAGVPEDLADPHRSAERALADRELRTRLAGVARAWHLDLQGEHPSLDGHHLTPQRAALWTILAGEVARWLEGAVDAPVGASTLATLEHRANPPRTRSRLPNATYDAICEALETSAPKLAVRYPKAWSCLGAAPVPSPGTLGQRFEQGAHEWRRRRDGLDPMEPWALLLPWPFLLLRRERGWAALAGAAAVLALFVGGTVAGRPEPPLAPADVPSVPSTATPEATSLRLPAIAPPEGVSIRRPAARRPTAGPPDRPQGTTPDPSPPPPPPAVPDPVAPPHPGPAAPRETAAALEAPVAAAVAPSSGLGDEASALQRARVHVAAADPLAALTILEAWEDRFPDGQLVAEADAWRWRALEAAGSQVEAGALARELLRAGRHPHLERTLRTSVARAALAEGRCDDLLVVLESGPRLGATLERAGRRCRKERAR